MANSEQLKKQKEYEKYVKRVTPVHSLPPVSYTHLDVYKRQIVHIITKCTINFKNLDICISLTSVFVVVVF